MRTEVTLGTNFLRLLLTGVPIRALYYRNDELCFRERPVADPICRNGYSVVAETQLERHLEHEGVSSGTLLHLDVKHLVYDSYLKET